MVEVVLLFLTFTSLQILLLAVLQYLSKMFPRVFHWVPTNCILVLHITWYGEVLERWDQQGGVHYFLGCCKTC